MPAPRRSGTRHPPWTRVRYLALASATILVGLAVHWRGAALGPTLQDLLGDALWAMMIAWWIGAAAPRASLRVRSIGALAICLCVEVSQLYHAPWLDAFRDTTAGRLVLGNTFGLRDLAAYTAGVFAAALLEAFIRRRHRRRSAT